MIISYTVTCIDDGGSVSGTVFTSNFTATIGGLSPYSVYTCSIVASTIIGNSPGTTLNFTTATGGECY